MQILKNPAIKSRSHSALPAELNLRLRFIARRHYRDQIDTLSMVFPHSEDTMIRWYLQHEAMPYLHIMETRNHGNLLMLYVWIPRLRSAIKLQKQLSKWDVIEMIPESALLNETPARFLESSAAWLKKPASKSQMYTLAKQLLLPVHRLPRLTAFNAQLLLQSTILHRHLPRVRSLVDAIGESGAYVPTRLTHR